MAARSARWRLSCTSPIRRCAQLLAENFENWTEAIENCLKEAGSRLPKRTDKKALAQFVLTAMEGGVMQARTHRDVAYFDRAVTQLQGAFRLAAAARRKRQHRGKRWT